MSVRMLKPGLMVALRTAVNGGVSYSRVDLDVERVDASGAARARWETTRTIADVAEYERAVKARSAIRGAITAVCSRSSFGLLCPMDARPALEDAIAEARRIEYAHNATATWSRVEFGVLMGQIADSDETAAAAIAGEIRELLAEMREGIDDGDVKRIRDAANRARELGAVLTEDAGQNVERAISQARAAARAITAKVVKGGSDVALVVAGLRTDAIEDARFKFLQFDTPGAIVTVEPEARAVEIEIVEFPDGSKLQRVDGRLSALPDVPAEALARGVVAPLSLDFDWSTL